jgi:ABC-2 type transport system permease protein
VIRTVAIDLQRLLFSALKEGQILWRDRFTLILLLVMPVVFVLILSLALRDAFGPRPGAELSMLVSDPDADIGPRIAQILQTSGVFAVTTTQTPFDEEFARKTLAEARSRIVIGVPSGAAVRAMHRAAQLLGSGWDVSASGLPVTLTIVADPKLRADYRRAVDTAIGFALRQLEIEVFAQALAAMGLKLPEALASATPIPGHLLFMPLGVPERDAFRLPTAVQQNAPAWILLAMFFLAVPLSVSFVKERAQGSLTRLRLQGVPGWVVLGGKALPYLLINLLQFSLVLAACVYLLPLIGGETLALGQSRSALLVVGFASSLAAIGFGSLVAVYARTAEQATTFAATAILILAAVGGILVPKAVMPDFMQRLADLSPLSWGLDGFLDVFVNNGGVRDALPESALLLAFSAVTHLLAIARYRRRD